MIIRRGVIDQLTLLGETRAVARAIPGVLGFVVFERATEVWASRCSGRQKSNGRLKSVYSKLWMKKRARGIENGSIRIGFSYDKVAENIGGNHGIGHAPLVKSRCNEYVGRGFGILTDIRDIIKRHTILRCPLADDLGVVVVLADKIFKLLPTTALLTRTMSATAEE